MMEGQRMTELARLLQNYFNPNWTDGKPIETVSAVDVNAATVIKRKPVQETDAIRDAIARAEREGRVIVNQRGPGGSLDPAEPRTTRQQSSAAVGEAGQERRRKAKKPELVEASFVATSPRSFIFTVPLHTSAGDNFGSKDRHRRIGRAGHERTACTRTFAKGHSAWSVLCIGLANGCKVRVTLTRLAPRALDRINVEASLKYCSDTVAQWLGIDDNDSRIIWMPCEQRTGGSSGVEVRLELA
jgi:hypothetical protein